MSDTTKTAERDVQAVLADLAEIAGEHSELLAEDAERDLFGAERERLRELAARHEELNEELRGACAGMGEPTEDTHPDLLGEPELVGVFQRRRRRLANTTWRDHPYPGARMRHRRLERGVSLRELAAELEVSPAQLSRWERQREVMPLEQREHAERFLGLPAGALGRAGGEEE